MFWLRDSVINYEKPQTEAD